MEFNCRDVEVTMYHEDDISEKTVRFQHIPTGTCIEVIDRSQHKAYTRGMLEMEKLIMEKTNQVCHPFSCKVEGI